MTLPASGPLALTDIQTEFGGTNPIALNEYYAGGGLVPAGTTGTYGAVPSSGALSVQNFYGTSALIPIYIEEVFSTYLYTGTGSAQTITNGIDFSTNGGLLWLKARNDTRNNWLYDTNRGYQYGLRSDLDFAETTTPDALTAFNNNGFSIGTSSNINASGNTLVSWSFRQQPKFFDVVTYTGVGGANPQNISHNLGSTPGFIMVKHYSASGNNWVCYHTSLGNTQGIILNGTGAAITSSLLWNNTSPTSTQFTVGTSAAVNGSGTYVAYLFAHNAGGFGLTGTDNVISCGSYTGNGAAGGQLINLGYEAQWVMIKNASSAADWWMLDTMRGWVVNGDFGSDQALFANSSAAEQGQVVGQPDALGFRPIQDNVNQSGQTYIYIAIRRGPMKVPTSGTSVYNAIARTGTGAAATITGVGFPTDLVLSLTRNFSGTDHLMVDRLRGSSAQLFTNLTAAESTNATSVTSLASNDGISVGTDYPIQSINYASGYTYVTNFFRRAPSFFDEVCYTGTGSQQNITHNLGVAPELMIVKRRSAAGGSWATWATSLTADQSLALNTTDDKTAVFSVGFWGSTYPTSSVFTVGSNVNTNSNTVTYVAYLFATCAGVSKVGSYTGTGALQTVNCGFAAGARFVLIKRTDSTGDWWTYDSARGITSGNDPYLYLNSSAAEVTGTNYVDTTAVGFQVTAAAPAGLNASGGTYIFLAIA